MGTNTMETYCKSGFMTPELSTKSRHSDESPAIFPKAQTACSCTSSIGLDNNSMNTGTEPHSMTIRVCCDVPDAIFVSAQAASN